MTTDYSVMLTGGGRRGAGARGGQPGEPVYLVVPLRQIDDHLAPHQLAEVAADRAGRKGIDQRPLERQGFGKVLTAGAVLVRIFVVRKLEAQTHPVAVGLRRVQRVEPQ